MKTFGAITDVPGITVGHASDFKALTGCTVVLCEKGAVGAVDIRGAATGTREIDALSPHHLVETIHAVLLTGGSAFGLDAAGGVMTFLEERGKGFDVGKTTVPIVPAAVIYDLGIGDFRVRPGHAMGYQACLNASTRVLEGSVGVGTGATVGKLFGMERAMKGGVGSSSLRGPHGLVVGALVVVNAFGDVVHPDSHQILAGARTSKRGFQFADSTRWIKRGRDANTVWSLRCHQVIPVQHDPGGYCHQCHPLKEGCSPCRPDRPLRARQRSSHPFIRPSMGISSLSSRSGEKERMSTPWVCLERQR